MRNISFALTEPQFTDGTKDVTRRLGWEHAVDGDILRAVKKVMGFKKGEEMQPIAIIQLVSVRREPLDLMITDPVYGMAECRREGFPHMTPHEFVEFFCDSHAGCFPERVITRLEFRKLPLIKQAFAMHLRHQNGGTMGYTLTAGDTTTVIGARSVWTPRGKAREKHPPREIFTLHGTGEFNNFADFLVAYQKQLDHRGAMAVPAGR